MNVVAFGRISRRAGGLFYAVGSLCKELKSGGVSLSVYGSKDSFVAEDINAWAPVPVVPYKTFGPIDSSFRLRHMLSGNSADLIHVHGLWLDDQWTALQWQKKTGKPVVISPHGMLDPWAVRNSAWKKKLVGWVFANESLRKASCIHALCQSEAESIRAYGLRGPVAIIPNGVDLPKIETSSSKPQTPNEKKQLLFLGRIHPKKGLKELIDAWVMEHGAWRREWQLVIAGWDDGGYEQGLRNQVNELGAGDSIKFAGPKFGNEKEALLRSADAFILPSLSEGLPMSILEAWSYGLPVMMTDFCNIPEGFHHAAALRIEPNAASIAHGLAQLRTMSNTDLGAMGAKGRELVERQFTWDKIARDMKAVYEWCLGGEKPACIQES